MKPRFFPYLLADYPSAEAFEDVLRLTDHYADTIEIGLPFTDPVADGPVIQQASGAVLENGFNLDHFFQRLRSAKLHTPVAVMTYANLIYARGQEAFYSECKESGVTSLIVPDVPFEEAAPWRDLASSKGLHWISFISLTTSPERLSRIAVDSEGFIYLLALTGITGSQIHSPERILQKSIEIRQHTATPVALGFGIKSAADVKPFLGKIDAFIVGSKIIEILKAEKPLALLEKFYQEFTGGLLI